MSEAIPYSNRELDEKFGGIHDKLDAILTQTTKTNGRVNSLEKNVDNLNIWRGATAGAIAVIVALIVPLVIAGIIRFLF